MNLMTNECDQINNKYVYICKVNMNGNKRDITDFLSFSIKMEKIIKNILNFIKNFNSGDFNRYLFRAEGSNRIAVYGAVNV